MQKLNVNGECVNAGLDGIVNESQIFHRSRQPLL